ncbi:nucleotide-binding universal stress UspA family protein [Dongia mobilis]|uniref:Nucleotide-binding universal stress UspA family protein n=1 Tax=Dongia mobilis TaxID=578943 RepID=A0A4R6WMK6_9PROT|nr:universal stress protein [Dongia mobilis]TDQ82212.1 nucleotide-binding universal stress UspA family protein [Dongia mobilis]
MSEATNAKSGDGKPGETRAGEDKPGMGRVFLVVVDESPEMKVALRYACRRAARTGGRVAMVYVMEPADYQEWVGVSNLMREEARQQAEAIMQKMAGEVQKHAQSFPILYFREGERQDEVLKLIDEEPAISILVLGAATGPKGPGPLISSLTGKQVGKLRIPITIVPGNLSDADIENIA